MKKWLLTLSILTAGSLLILVFLWSRPGPALENLPASGFEYVPHSIKNVSPEIYLKYRPRVRRGKGYVSDPVVGHLRRPRYFRRNFLKEHPRGKIDIRTNNLGFREDGDLDLAKPADEVRVLITGDSHTDGVVSNSESFPNRLESRLNAAGLRVRFNVINGGVGLYGPYNYSRFLFHHAGLKPDLYIVTFYIGNDFSDAARLLEATRDSPLQRPRGYMKKLRRCQKQGIVVSQSINQAYFFKIFPLMKEPALMFTMEQFEDIKKFCDHRGIELIVFFLPTKIDVERTAE